MEGKRLTSYAMEELECPKCGHKHSLKKYKVINVTEKAKLKEEIMKNRLYQFSCEECEYMAPLTYDSLYVDSQRNIMIYMAPVMNAEIKAEIAELEQEKGIDKRLVDNINDLKEEISQILPYYMIPSDIIVLDKFPYNTNHKIDSDFFFYFGK